MSLLAYGTSFTEFLRLGRWNNQNNSIRKNTLFVKCNISKTEMQSISNIFFWRIYGSAISSKYIP